MTSTTMLGRCGCGVLMFSMVLTAIGCGDAKQRNQSNEHLREFALAIVTYQDRNNKYPDSLADLKPVMGAAEYDAMLKNPLTGDNPGYEYVKPPETPDSISKTIVLYQLRDGKRDESLKVAYADTSVREIEKE